MEEDDEEDPEFSALVQELFPDLSVDEHLKFDESVPTAEPSFDIRKLRWRQGAQLECIDRVKRPEVDCEKVVSKKSKDGDEKSRKKSVPNIMDTLTMLSNICQCPELGKQIIETLDGIMQRLETLQLQKKKQHSFNKYYKV